MKFTLLLYSYFPYGGQQRDMLRIAKELLARKHDVEVITMSWKGEKPAGLTVTLAPIKKGLNRLKRYKQFSIWIGENLDSREDEVMVGFSKMPHLDVYFAADPCFMEKAETQRGRYYKFTSRFRHFRDFEKVVFEQTSNTEVLVLTPAQGNSFEHYYPGCSNRLHQLPPGISVDRKVEKRDRAKGLKIRQELGLVENTKLVLQIGSGFKVKGVDRSLKAIASLPLAVKENVHFLLVGEDRSKRFNRLAKKLGINALVTILPGRDDIPDLLQGADLMLHPAYSESAGYVLLEATIAGLPVLTTASCGYAFHIEKAGSGEVIGLPFYQESLNTKLEQMLTTLDSQSWSQNGLDYGHKESLYSMPEFAADFLETVAGKKAESLKC